jgi:hypothetical protein
MDHRSAENLIDNKKREHAFDAIQKQRAQEERFHPFAFKAGCIPKLN